MGYHQLKAGIDGIDGLRVVNLVEVKVEATHQISSVYLSSLIC